MDGVSVVIPAFNEEDGIEQSVGSVLRVMQESGIDFELIVVDDGSSDRTGTLSEAAGARVLSLPENRGYGAALKAGIGRAKHEIIVITDADGTYPAESIPILLRDLGEYDMVVGARVGKHVAIPLIRRPAKWFLRRLAGLAIW